MCPGKFPKSELALRQSGPHRTALGQAPNTPGLFELTQRKIRGLLELPSLFERFGQHHGNALLPLEQPKAGDAWMSGGEEEAGRRAEDVDQPVMDPSQPQQL